jgi:hypothetical protein
LRALFAGLQSDGRGLCLVTTREPIADLTATRDTTTPEWRLDHLTEHAGAAVLRGHGVTGPQAELEAASGEVKGHAFRVFAAYERWFEGKPVIQRGWWQRWFGEKPSPTTAQWRNEYPWPDRTPETDLDEAAALIKACGYHRRDQELADARAALG